MKVFQVAGGGSRDLYSEERMYVEWIKEVVHKEQEYRVIEEVKEDLQEGYAFCCCRNILEMYYATFLFFLTYQP